MSWAHHLSAAAFLFALGASVGSFLNVCIHRIPTGLSLLRPPSRCPGCGSEISPRDNLPVLGWLLLGGRCRSCRMAISPRYPAVEAIVGLLLVLSYLVASPGALLEHAPALLCWRLLDALARSAFLVTGAMIALDRGLVPGRVALFGLIAALLLAAARPGEPPLPVLIDRLLGALCVGVPVWLARRPRRDPSAPRLVADGDPAFSAMVGALVGLRLVLPVLAIASAILLGRPLLAIARRRFLPPGPSPAIPPLPLGLALGLAGLSTIPTAPWPGPG